MNNDPMVTPVEAKHAARGVFLAHYPDESGWFDLAWDRLSTLAPTAVLSDSSFDVLGLHASSEPTGAEGAMIDMIALLVHVCLIQMPQAHDALFEKLKSVCEIKGKSDRYVGDLWELLGKQLGLSRSPLTERRTDTSPQYGEQDWLLWIFEGLHPPNPVTVAIGDLNQYLESGKDFDIFICNAHVHTKRVEQNLSLSETQLKFLFVFLLQRGIPCTAEQLYTGCIDGGEAFRVAAASKASSADFDHLVGNVVSSIRTKMKKTGGLSERAFGISDKKSPAGFRCFGSATVCILMTAHALKRCGITLQGQRYRD